MSDQIQIFKHELVIEIHHFNTLLNILLGSRTMKSLTYIQKSFNCVDVEAKKGEILF